MSGNEGFPAIDESLVGQLERKAAELYESRTDEPLSGGSSLSALARAFDLDQRRDPSAGACDHSKCRRDLGHHQDSDDLPEFTRDS